MTRRRIVLFAALLLPCPPATPGGPAPAPSRQSGIGRAAAAAPSLSRPITIALRAAPEGGPPAAVVVEGARILVDLSGVPPGARLWRATLHTRRELSGPQGRSPGALERIVIRPLEPRPLEPLELMPPRFTAFDATAAARAALAARGERERPELVLEARGIAGWRRAATRLDVSLSVSASRAAPPRGEPAERAVSGEAVEPGAVRSLRAWHLDGDTFLTWADPRLHPPRDALTLAELAAWKRGAEKESEVRYRIYRLDRPITPKSLPEAELADEVDRFTAYNGEAHGLGARGDLPALRYVARDGEPPLPAGGGIWVRAARRPERAWYAVSRAVDGRESFEGLAEGTIVAGPIEERPGPGHPVLQRVEHPERFQYIEGAELRTFTRWESPPRSNVPSRPFDYLVAIPPEPRDPAPLCIALHCWGGSLRGGYGWWYGAREGAMLLSTNQIPYDWWACYHESLGTLKSLRDGVSRSFTPKRIWSFADWMRTRWRIDEARIFLGGSSMGGAGVSHWIRYGDRVAYGISWVGIHIPALSDHFRGSYENVVGRLEWNLPHESGLGVFDWLDDARFLRENPEREIPFLAYSNGKNDSGIGWRQAVEFTRALQETHRPHLFVWGQSGHGERAYFPTPAGGGDNVRGGLDIRLDKSLPAFTRCSLDDDLGDGDPSRGAPRGQINRYLRWKTGAVIDEPRRWSAEIWLIDEAPRPEATVDVTPRRCRRFRPEPGARLVWTSREAARAKGPVVQRGDATADRHALVTVEGFRATKKPRRLEIRRGGE